MNVLQGSKKRTIITRGSSNDRKEIGLVITLCEKAQIRNYRIGELTGR